MPAPYRADHLGSFLRPARLKRRPTASTSAFAYLKFG